MPSQVEFTIQVAVLGNAFGGTAHTNLQRIAVLY